MAFFNIVASTNESTVVTTYEAEKNKNQAYQSESELENEFITQLCAQGYEKVNIAHEKELINNLRHQLEKLNSYVFSDTEWKRFFNDKIANKNYAIEEKTKIIQEDNIQILIKDDGSSKNIRLIDKYSVHNNSLQVLNQYTVTQDEGAKYDNRYDVTILVNGFPLIHIELKKRGVAIKEAFNQINRYQRDSFWASTGLYEYVQIFVISNGTNTKYYSNTTRFNSIKEQSNTKKGTKTSNSFEFTSYWSDSNNKIITDLVDFTKTFFAKHTILNILTKYCVFTYDKNLLVLRPYQITATERIVNRVVIANNYKKYGNIAGGGYIWHTTGSGKTLTSFKTAKEASKLSFIDKVLFVVDRKDLDYQTMKEYDKFEKGAANSNTNTSVLTKQLSNSNSKIIITTIQKLSRFINANKKHDIYDKQVVIIFDECHRSQFGEMHKSIVKSFKKYYMFGFTGTPIFSANASNNFSSNIFTTEQTFGDQLHTYTIVDAINDKNVLPFKVDYVRTLKIDDDIDDEQVYDIAREKTLLNDERITKVTEYILNNYNLKTYRHSKNYYLNTLTNIKQLASKSSNNIDESKEQRLKSGFNSIFAVSSIEAAIKYYKEFKKQMDNDLSKKIKIATIFSYSPNEYEENLEGMLGEEDNENTESLDESKRDFLEEAIKDYNNEFNTAYDTTGERFQNYYKDVSLRMKNKEIDLLIVVNMFLTGFDATTLNTLWVDKNLKMHGLIQAFSRTNRILNSVKTHGNIVCFRNLSKRVDSAISLFGNKDAGGIVLLKSFKDYYYGYKDENGTSKEGFKSLVDKLLDKYKLPISNFTGEQNQKDFIVLMGSILKIRNILLSYDDFKDNEILTERELQDYLGIYQDLRDEWKGKAKKGKLTDISNDVVFEMELIKQIDINIDYILMLVKKYQDTNCNDEELKLNIQKAIDSSPDLRSKKALIESFILGLNDVDEVIIEWHDFIMKNREIDLLKIIKEEKLKESVTRTFLEQSFRDGEIKTIGTEIDNILPPVSRFGDSRKSEKKQNVIERLQSFFEQYYGIGGSNRF